METVDTKWHVFVLEHLMLLETVILKEKDLPLSLSLSLCIHRSAEMMN